MKKDDELPLAIRIARWALVAYLAGFVVKSFMEWFG